MKSKFLGKPVTNIKRKQGVAEPLESLMARQANVSVNVSYVPRNGSALLSPVLSLTPDVPGLAGIIVVASFVPLSILQEFIR